MSLGTINININNISILYTNMNWEPILSHLDHAFMYAGVIWFVFMFSNLYRLDLHNKNPCSISRSMMKRIKIWIGNQSSLDLVMVI